MSQFAKCIALATAYAAVGLAGCEAPSAVEDDYGHSVRSMVSAQTANPDATVENKDRKADKGDGQRSEAVLKDYRELGDESEDVSRDLIIQMGGGGGSR